MKLVPHLTDSANSVSAWRRIEASSSSLNLSRSRDSSATLNWKRQTQIGVAWFEGDEVRVYVWLLDTDLAEQFRESAARLAAQGGKDLGEQLDQSFRRRGRGIEMPGAEVPLL